MKEREKERDKYIYIKHIIYRYMHELRNEDLSSIYAASVRVCVFHAEVLLLFDVLFLFIVDVLVVRFVVIVIVMSLVFLRSRMH